MSADEFSQQYLETWVESDTDKRHANLRAVWAVDGKMVVSSIGATITGIDKIIEHIDKVYNDVIIGKGVKFSYTQRVDAGDATLLSSAVTAPNGAVVGKGVDIIFRNDDGLVTAAYMFMGLE